MNSFDDNNLLAKEWNSQMETFAAHAARRHVPLFATFELTARCSLKCKMCYVAMDAAQVKRKGRELTAEEWISLGRQTIDAGSLYLLITGGEPLLRPDFPEIYSELCKMGFIVTMNTNATLMNDKYFDLFSKYPPTAVAVTLYGASPETYEKVCGSAAGFEQTLRGLEMFSELPTYLEVRTTFIKDNMHELDAIRAISKRFTDRYAINYMVFGSDRVDASGAAQCRMSPSQCMDLVDENVKYYNNIGEDERPPVDPELEEYFKSLSPDRDLGLDIPPAIISCMAAKSMYMISWDGKMVPCGTFSHPYTLPLEEGFLPAWNRLPTLFEDIKHPKVCYDCELLDSCPNCPGYMQADTGDFEKVSEYLCGLAKERAARLRAMK